VSITLTQAVLHPCVETETLTVSLSFRYVGDALMSVPNTVALGKEVARWHAGSPGPHACRPHTRD
jgi:hypothetical protein